MLQQTDQRFRLMVAVIASDTDSSSEPTDIN